MQNPFLQVMQILTSESTSLKELASLTSFQPMYFYQGADLRGSDLSGQDLSGLNFERADLRGVDLDNVQFDEGAFNGAILDEKFSFLKDQYDIYLDDIEERFFKYISINYKFRPKFLDSFLSAYGVKFGEFAEYIGISAATLRRVRDGLAISNETMFKVVDEIGTMMCASPPDAEAQRMKELAKQPFIQVGYYEHRGAWIPVKRGALQELFAEVEFVNTVRYGTDWRETKKSYFWKSKPSTLAWAYSYYQKYPRAWGLSDEELEALKVRNETLMFDNGNGDLKLV